MADWHAAASLAPRTATDATKPLPFHSRRSPVVCRHACVATSQPLASEIGIHLLRQGANAADAAIAIAAVLAVVEPCSTGLGGDAFCLYYTATDKKVRAVNGSGKSPKTLSASRIAELKDEAFKFSPHAVTVPGAAKAWEDIYQTFGSGKFTFAQLLEPAATLAEEGFPVSPITAHHWNAGMKQIQKWIDIGNDHVPMTIDGVHAPKAGQVFSNPDMARVLRELGEKGSKDGFYESPNTGEAIVKAVQKHGGFLTMDDLRNHHTSLFPEPLCADYRGVSLWQVPPNGQGVAALVALTGLEQLEQENITSIRPSNLGSADTYHVMMEMMRLGFADARAHVADPHHLQVAPEWFVDKDRIANRAKKLFDPEKSNIQGQPLSSSETVSFQVVDKEGNAMSFVNSNFMGFGTGIVPDGCGFTLQNRGFGFCRDDPTHPNYLAEGGKRPYHTIIPGMLTHTDSGELYATISNMGGNQQPQGHLQLTVDLVAGGLDPQAAVDMPRFCIASGTQDGSIHLEEGVEEEVVKELQERMGHDLRPNVSGHARSIFGRAQIIKKDPDTGVLWAGSDGRADGCAIGF